MDYSIWKDYWARVCNKCDQNGYQTLTPDERIWLNALSLIGDVENGGLISFYYNHGADYLEETIEDLIKINAKDIVNVMNKINKLFPNGKPSRDVDQRNEVINSWEDGKYEELFEEVDEEFYNLQMDLELKLEPVIRRVMSQEV